VAAHYSQKGRFTPEREKNRGAKVNNPPHKKRKNKRRELAGLAKRGERKDSKRKEGTA